MGLIVILWSNSPEALETLYCLLTDVLRNDRAPHFGCSFDGCLLTVDMGLTLISVTGEKNRNLCTDGSSYFACHGGMAVVLRTL